MQPQSTLVWTQGRVELHSVTPVDGHTSIILFVGDSELDDPLWDLNDGECATVLWVLDEERLEGGGDLVDGLQSAPALAL